MTEHNWMIEVLEDLETYAKKSELSSLQCLLGEARLKIEDEIYAISTADTPLQGFALNGKPH